MGIDEYEHFIQNNKIHDYGSLGRRKYNIGSIEKPPAMTIITTITMDCLDSTIQINPSNCRKLQSIPRISEINPDGLDEE